jgi:hypothetical protein
MVDAPAELDSVMHRTLDQAEHALERFKVRSAGVGAVLGVLALSEEIGARSAGQEVGRGRQCVAELFRHAVRVERSALSISGRAVDLRVHCLSMLA